MITYTGFEYRCAANESFDSVALLLYGSERYAHELMNANPALCGLTVFSGGERLKLPDLDVPRNSTERALANTIAPWKT